MKFDTIETDRLIIRKGKLEDYVKVHEYNFNALQNIKGVNELIKMDPEEVKGWFNNDIESWHRKNLEDKSYSFIVYLKETMEPIADITFDRNNPKNNSLEISCWLHPNYWGCGYMKEALIGSIEYIFNQGYDNVIYGYIEDNVRSKRLCEKLGFINYDIEKDFSTNYGNATKNITIMSKELFYKLHKKNNNKGIVYHGSKEHGLKKLEPRKSTHGQYLYATKDKVLALHFGKRCGDDLTYDIDHFDTDENGPWELVENIPGAFEKMYATSSSIYSISDETFKDIGTQFDEVVSQVGVDVINEEYYENVYEGILAAEKAGLIKIYRYPNKPHKFKKDGENVLDKYRFYKYGLKKALSKEDFDRLVYLHPILLGKINELAKELNYDYYYEPKDLVEIFKNRIKRQLSAPNSEQYVDSAYISICAAFPELKKDIEEVYKKYNELVFFQIDAEEKTVNKK